MLHKNMWFFSSSFPSCKVFKRRRLVRPSVHLCLEPYLPCDMGLPQNNAGPAFICTAAGKVTP